MLGTHVRQRRGQRRLERLLGLLWLLAAGEGAWSLERPPVAPAPQAMPYEPRLHVVVHQGRLSVDLHEADLGEVLARLSQQAGIAVVGPVAPGLRISTQFARLALTDGLRRLLRVAGLSYAIVSAQDRGGSRPITTLHVLGSSGGGPPLQVPASRRSLPEPADPVALLYEQALLASLTERESDEALPPMFACVSLVVPPDADVPESVELEVDASEDVELDADAPEGEEPLEEEGGVRPTGGVPMDPWPEARQEP